MFIFASNGLLNNITHSTSSNTDQIIVGDTGTYYIIFFVFGGSSSLFYIAVNGTIVTNTFYASSAPNVGQTIMKLNAGDVVTLVNNGPAPVMLSPSHIDEDAVKASVIMQQIGS